MVILLNKVYFLNFSSTQILPGSGTHPYLQAKEDQLMLQYVLHLDFLNIL